MKKTKLTFVDLFCGAGGLSLGFEVNSFDLLLANDHDRHSIETFKKNRPGLKEGTVILGDVRSLYKKIGNLTDGGKQIDLIVGGPPCQGFSMANRQRLINDPRNHLYKEFVKIVSRLQPRAFMMENVKGMLSAAEQIVDDFNKKGYIVFYKIINAKDYGIPQNRERLIYIGLQKNSFKNPDGVLESIFNRIEKNKQLKELPLESAFWGLRKLTARKEKNDTEINSKKSGLSEDVVLNNDHRDSSYVKKINGGTLPKLIYNHKARYNNDRDLQIFKLLPQGGKSDHPDIAHIMPYNSRKDIFKDKFYKLVLSKPSKTITSHMKFDCHMYIHPCETRGLTPREAARIQSFPDNYIFYGPYTQWYNQIGNAVPPLLASIFAGALKEYL